MVAGFDALPEALIAVEDGRMQVTARQSLDTMAVQAMELACRQSNAQWKDTDISLGVELITQSSVAQAAVRAMRIFPEITRDLIERSYQQQDAATFLEALLDNMPTMLFVKEAKELRYVRVNNARETWFGVAHGTQLGKTPYDLYSPQMAATIVATDRQVLNSGKPLEMPEEELHIPGMGVRYVHTKKIPLFDLNGKPIFLLGISEDITERKQAQEILTQRAQELELAYQALQENQEQLLAAAKMASLGSLVAGVAHELNTPIGNALMAATTLIEHTRGIKDNYAQGLKRSALETYLAEATQVADILVRNLRRGADLVNSFKQVAVDQTSSQRRSFSLATVVSEIMLTLWPSIKKSTIEVRQDIPAELSMDSYPGPLGQVVTNLVNNALIHGVAGQPSGLITISARVVDAQWLTLTVQDNGTGIEAKNLELIFDPFFTTRLGTGGSGLGLNIAHNIVTGLLGGKIAVTSEMGAGSQFCLTLPVAAP
jgi:PAS domain S-box-containing protein